MPIPMLLYGTTVSARVYVPTVIPIIFLLSGEMLPTATGSSNGRRSEDEDLLFSHMHLPGSKMGATCITYTADKVPTVTEHSELFKRTLEMSQKVEGSEDSPCFTSLAPKPNQTLAIELHGWMDTHQLETQEALSSEGLYLDSRSHHLGSLCCLHCWLLLYLRLYLRLLDYHWSSDLEG